MNFSSASHASDCVCQASHIGPLYPLAEQDGAVIGHLLFSRLPIETSGGTVEALALAPMAVLPGCQRQGVGSQLIRRGLAMCRERGHRIVVVPGRVEGPEEPAMKPTPCGATS